MKSILLKAGLITGLLLPYTQVAAASDFAAACASFGTIEPETNPSYQHINCLLTNAALQTNIPPEVVKAVATQENGRWEQFDSKGDPIISDDNGIGLMQVTNQASYNQERLKSDIVYNIQAGVEVLSSMYDRRDLPKISGMDRSVIENWYFPVMAYNGTVQINRPVYKASGLRNTGAYQEKVLAKIQVGSFLNDTTLAAFPFKAEDFPDVEGSNRIEFKVAQYTLTEVMHRSRYDFEKDDEVVITQDGASLRTEPTTSSSHSTMQKNTVLVITGPFVYDRSADSKNQFVWYPVKTLEGKTGYVSSAYLEQKLDAPAVKPIDDNDTSVSGTAPAGVTVHIQKGTQTLGTVTAAGDGRFKISLGSTPLPAGTMLTVFYQNHLNMPSLPATIQVTDKTAPGMPTVYAVSNKASTVSGKAEAGATVIVRKGTSPLGTATADEQGNFKVRIPVQNHGTTLSVTAKDSAGHISAAKTVTVTKAAPDMPTVSAVSNKASTVSGKTEPNAVITVRKGTSPLGTATADEQGNFKVAIPVQNHGTALSITAKDSTGRSSAARSVTIVRTGPDLPIVDAVKADTTSVTGKTEKGAVVTVKIGSKTYKSKPANSYGRYTVTVPKQPTGKKLYIYATDTKGMISATRTVIVTK